MRDRCWAALLTGFAVAAAAAEPATPPDRLAIGVDYGGGHVRAGFGPRWAGELRFQQGHAPSVDGDVRADAFGLRGIRFLKVWRTWRFFVAAEGDYIATERTVSSYSVSGFAAGAAIGAEVRLLRRLCLGVDAGPYLFSLHEKTTRTSTNAVSFVANSSLTFYLF